MRWEPDSEQQTTAGSVALSRSRGAVFLTAIPVAPMKTCASNRFHCRASNGSKSSGATRVTPSVSPALPTEWMTAFPRDWEISCALRTPFSVKA